MKGSTKNPKLKTLHKLATGLDMTVSVFKIKILNPC